MRMHPWVNDVNDGCHNFHLLYLKLSENYIVEPTVVAGHLE